ncbi:uncharacterized protein LOC131608950 [Vicia villosa]|uniref:uncharacterized protein LOC131608950 n=1 Tax=Vicia villosa TaxID=3911 RepID=UPI00273B83BB|nr:uncharacterized protein LOC131608950 [Vicia villosa]
MEETLIHKQPSINPCVSSSFCVNKKKMETISMLPSTHQPVRSISLPTRIHPSSQRIDALLNHFKPQISSQSVSRIFSFEADTIQSDLVVLAELYNCMEELFHSQQTQQALLHYQNGKLVEDSLGGSVTLLDACSSSRELLLNLKQHVHTIQSAIRRRRGNSSSSVERSIDEYDCFRKKAKKEISKQLCEMKRMENKVKVFSLMGQDQNMIFLAGVLRETSMITISIFRSLLLFISTPIIRTTKGSSLISKLNPTRLFSSEKEQKNTDFAGFLSVLEKLNDNVCDLEGGLDCIFRCLVRNRVSFLNMLAH